MAQTGLNSHRRNIFLTVWHEMRKEIFVMIISILTILFVIALHLFPRRIREKVIYRLKRVFARIRSKVRGPKYSKTS